MKQLDFQTVRQMTVGALTVREESDGIHFAKLTDKQLSVWDAQSASLSRNARACTGIRLDFHTNSKTLSLKLAVGGRLEILLDDNSRYLYNGDEATKEICVPLCDGLGNRKDDIRVTVVLPSHGEAAVLSSVSLDDDAYVVRHAFSRKILFIGDSITQGYASVRDSNSYAYRLSRMLNAESVIQGIGGAACLPESFDAIDFDPDFVIVAYGTNDFSHCSSLEELTANMDGFFERVSDAYVKQGIKVFYLSPLWREKRYGKPTGRFEDVIAKEVALAEKHGFICLDGLTLVPPNPDFFADAYLHPNDEGFSYYAEALIRELLPHIFN